MSSAVRFVAVVMAIVGAVASVAVGDALPVGAGEGVGSALQRGRLAGRVVHARLLVGRQLHAVRTAAHTLGVRRRETEMAAVSVGVDLPVAGVGT